MHPQNRVGRGGHSKAPMDGRGGHSKAPMDGRGGRSKAPTEPEEPEYNFKKIMEEVKSFGSSCLTWKERKDLENKRIVDLGGKAAKKQRLPLSVARPAMKNQKQRDDKLMKERLALGRFGALLGESSSTNKRQTDNRRKPIEMGLRASEGSFVNGCLHVDRLLKPASRNEGSDGFSMSQNNRRGKKSQGKRKGGNKNQKKKGGRGRGGKRH